MNRRERLLATLRGEPVDRPPVCFYELNGLDENPADSNPFNIYSHPSWTPLIELTREKTDRIVMRSVPFSSTQTNQAEQQITHDCWWSDQGSFYQRRTVHTRNKPLVEITRRDPDVNTVWTIEHLLKSKEDLLDFLQVPGVEDAGSPDITAVLATEQILGDTGIVMIDVADPLCEAAQLFHMADYTMIAYQEPGMFNELLQHFSEIIYQKVERVARLLPGRLWRLYGPEYASPPYLPPKLFQEYVTGYDTTIIQMIHDHGGYARIHSHGRLKNILPYILATGCDGLDPIEPPPQGDVSLQYVRENYGEMLVLFGNLEASDLENLPAVDFRKRVKTALQEGTNGRGRGFVLMPSACPYGRILSKQALENYMVMIEEVESRG